MEITSVFFQWEGHRELEHLDVGPDTTVGALKELLMAKHGFESEILIFLEDGEDPLDDLSSLHTHSSQKGVKVHIHRCRHVVVFVTFNGRTVERRFGPGATVALVKRWAAEKEFGMTKEEAGEHVLQISGSHDRPSPGTHIGSLAKCPECRVSFDLLPDQRVNGASNGE